MATAYMVPRYRVTLVQETGPEIAPQLPVHNPDVAYWVLRPYFDGLDREHFVSLLLDIKHRLIGLNVISIGHLSAAPVHPREVYKAAVTANAAAIIVAHNHPSGDPEPSPDDVATTRRLAEAGRILGIELLDHVVVGEDRYVSLRERGLFDPAS